MSTIIDRFNVVDDSKLPKLQTGIAYGNIVDYGESFSFDITWTANMDNINYGRNDGYYVQKLQIVSRSVVQENPLILNEYWEDTETSTDLEQTSFSKTANNNTLTRYRLGIVFVNNTDSNKNEYYYSTPFNVTPPTVSTLYPVSGITATSWTYVESNYGYFYPTLAMTNPNTGIVNASLTKMKIFGDSVFKQDFLGQSESLNVLNIQSTYSESYPSPTTVQVRIDLENCGINYSGTTQPIYLTSGETIPDFAAAQITVTDITATDATINITGNTSGSFYVVGILDGQDFGFSNNTTPTSVKFSDWWTTLEADTNYNVSVATSKCGRRILSNVVNFTTAAS